jgi:hypothetical protein
MGGQEGIRLDGELANLSGELFDRVACSTPVLPPVVDLRDSVGAFEVGAAPVGRPPRVRTAWTMAALGVAAMIGTLAVQAQKAPAMAKAQSFVRPGVTLAVAKVAAALPAKSEEATPAAKVAAATPKAATKATKHPARVVRSSAKAAAVPAGPPSDFPDVPLSAAPGRTPSDSAG